MKKTFALFCLLFITLSCKAQTLPLNSLEDINNGGYSKDTENKLPFWVGTWKGTVNNKEYTFQFTSFTHHLETFPNGDYYYIDELMGKFKVEDLGTNTILYNDLDSTNFEDYKIRFLGYNPYNGYSFSFYDDLAHCYNIVKFLLLKSPSNSNQVNYMSFEYDRDFYLDNDCPYPDMLDIPMFLPKVELVLTRQ
jgi:hypothetical protein